MWRWGDLAGLLSSQSSFFGTPVILLEKRERRRPLSALSPRMTNWLYGRAPPLRGAGHTAAEHLFLKH